MRVVAVVVALHALVGCPAASKIPICRDGRVESFDCSAGSDCFAPVFTDCGDGTCVDGDTAACDDGE